ncbi:MAG: divergent polysaccharide deacetylase family protein [Pseudomonadota bacterium]
MAGFRERLNQELKRRNLVKEEISPSLEVGDVAAAPLIVTNFSFRSFLIGLIVCTLFLLSLLTWAYFSEESTKKKLAERIPSKTVIVEKAAQDAVIEMPAVEVAPVVAVPPTDVKKPTPEEMAKATAAAIPGLFESTDYGLIPKIRADDGLTPFEAYKNVFTPTQGKPVISFVVTNLGLSETQTQSVLNDLPKEISLSFSPYARNLQTLIARTKEKGHEIWLTLPLQTVDYPLSDPGPLSLLKSASVTQNQDRLQQLLTAATGYSGLITNKGHTFSTEDSKTKPAFDEIFTRGLAIVETNASNQNFIRDIALRGNYPFASNDIWLDNQLTPAALNRQLRSAIDLGRAKNNVIVMLEPYPASIETVKKFIASSVSDEFQIAPVSAQVQYGE